MSLDQRYPNALMNTFGPPRAALVRGDGAWVWDEHGTRYLDLFAGIAVNSLGHNHPALVAAVTEQLKTLGHVSNFFATGPQVELAERLLGLLDGDGRVFFTNSGAEANEAAFKLTRRTGRSHVVAMEGGFHGRTMGALALTNKAAYRTPFEPLPGEVTFIPFGDLDALRAAVTDRTAAVLIEPLQGEAGVRRPPDGFLAGAREITRAAGALLWLDEVQTGIGRTGSWFAAAADPEIAPDIVTLAKGLGGGIPIGACIGLGEAGSLFEPGNHGTTFGGNPVACAGGLAVLDTIEKESLLDAANERGRRLTSILTSVSGVSDVEGAGLLLGAQLIGDVAPAVVTKAQDNGVLLNNTAPDRLRFAPPLTITDADLDAFGEVWPTIWEGTRQ